RAGRRRMARALLGSGRGGGPGGPGAPGGGGGEGNGGLDAIVREAAGNPFLVEQLVRYVALQRPGGGMSLGDALDARLAQLPSGARTLLETLALAGQPLDATVARDVAGLTEDERQLVTLLQAERWLKTTSRGER